MRGFYLRTHAKTFILENCLQSASNLFSRFCLPRPAIIVRINLYGTVPCQVLDLFYVQTGLKQSGNIGMTKDMGSYMTVRQLALNQSPETPVRTCLKPSNVVQVQKNHLNGSIPVCNISGCYGYGMRQSHCIYDNVAPDSGYFFPAT